MLKVLEEDVGEVKVKRNTTKWITKAMLDKMYEHRKWKNGSSEERKRQYRKLNNKLRRLTDQARDCLLYTSRCV